MYWNTGEKKVAGLSSNLCDLQSKGEKGAGCFFFDVMKHPLPPFRVAELDPTILFLFSQTAPPRPKPAPPSKGASTNAALAASTDGSHLIEGGRDIQAKKHKQQRKKSLEYGGAAPQQGTSSTTSILRIGLQSSRAKRRSAALLRKGL